MRHRKNEKKLGRSPSHRKALLASQVCSLIQEKRIKTTLPKAKLAGRLAEKMVTLGRRGTLAARRKAIAELRRPDTVAILFDEIAPGCEGRSGGYTRVVKLGRRGSDGSTMALLEWVDIQVTDKKKPAKKPVDGDK